MTPERARQLLGGLSTGILTPEERQTLFEAALHDQVLFNEVADELEFAAFLQSPETRAELAGSIPERPAQPAPKPWWTLRPAWLTFSAVAAAAAMLTVVIWHRPNQLSLPATSGETALHEPAAPPPASPQTASQPGAAKPKPAERPKQAQSIPHERKFIPPPAQPVHHVDAEVQPVPPPPPAEPSIPAPTPPVAAAAPMPPPMPPPAGVPAQPQPMSAARAFAPRAAFAQAQKAPLLPVALEVAVHDYAGTPLRNASIDIVNTATHAVTRATADASGHFVASALPPGGPYTVIASAPGFKTEERSGITITPNQPERIDIPLQVGSIAESVTVTAAAPSVQPALPINPQQVAVLDFANGAAPQQPGQQAGQQAADLLATQLHDSGVEVIARDKVQQAQNQAPQSQVPSGVSQQSMAVASPGIQQAAALGRSLGASAVVVGSVKPSGNAANSQVALTAEVIDTRNAKSLITLQASGDSLAGATTNLGLKVAAQLAPALEGAVTSVDAASVRVTFRSPARPRIGAIFDVFRGPRKLGQLTITSAYGQSAVGQFSGASQPRAGDRVTAAR